MRLNKKLRVLVAAVFLIGTTVVPHFSEATKWVETDSKTFEFTDGLYLNGVKLGDFTLTCETTYYTCQRKFLSTDGCQVGQTMSQTICQ